MWIKSQNEQILLDAKDIFLEPLSNRHISSKTVYIKSGDFIIGEYGSVEEAKTVLSEIVAAIDLCVKVYLMPQKGEVCAT